MNIPFLITGCPRSGTDYIANVMREVLGLRFGHEVKLRDGIADWTAGDDDYDHSPFKVIFHQVRHPVSSICSFDTIRPGSREVLDRVARINSSDSKLLTFMKYWYHWNVEVETLAPVLTYRIEDLPDAFPKICSIIGVDSSDKDLCSVQTNTNSRKHKPGYVYYTWDDLKKENGEYYRKVRTLSEEYGYT